MELSEAVQLRVEKNLIRLNSDLKRKLEDFGISIHDFVEVNGILHPCFYKFNIRSPELPLVHLTRNFSLLDGDMNYVGLNYHGYCGFNLSTLNLMPPEVIKHAFLDFDDVSHKRLDYCESCSQHIGNLPSWKL